MTTVNYDLAIIGGGAAGLVSGVAAGAVGTRTAIVEIEDRLGGECSWTGCVPSKALIHQASLAHRCGSNPDGNIMKKVQETVLKASKASKAKNLLDSYSVDLYNGSSSFKDNHTLIMNNGTAIQAKKFILCTGSSALIPGIEGLNEGYLTNREVWQLPDLPESLIIIGGGPIGTELAQSFYRLGTKVTLLEGQDRLLLRDDQDLARELTKALIDEGIDIRLNTMAEKVTRTDQGWMVEAGGDKISGQHLLIALGRQANTDGLNLEAAGVDYNRNGIFVNRHLRTTAVNIWAAGDCIGGPQFSHIAEIEAKTAVRNALFPLNSSVNYQGTPWTTFTDPEMAHLGLTEEECKERGYCYRIYSQEFAGDDRAVTEEATKGRVKIIASPYGKLLGVHILGPRAGELLNEFILARRKGLRLHEIGLTAHVYPTLGMAVQRATDDWFSEMAAKPFLRSLIRLFKR